MIILAQKGIEIGNLFETSTISAKSWKTGSDRKLTRYNRGNWKTNYLQCSVIAEHLKDFLRLDLEAPDITDGREDENNWLIENRMWNMWSSRAPFSLWIAKWQISNPGWRPNFIFGEMNSRNFRLETPDKAEDRGGICLKQGITSARRWLWSPFLSNRVRHWRILFCKYQSRCLYVLTLITLQWIPPVYKYCPYIQCF